MQNDINSILSKLAISHRTVMEKLMCDIGLHSGQVQILIALWDTDGLSQAELVRKLCVSPPTINKMINRLTDSDFVENKHCPHDKRLKRVYLTKKAVDIQPKVNKQLKSLEDLILKDFSETESVLLPIVLSKIANNLQSENK